ncbi:MAG TPA: excinuclease ABC subunit UvrC, partial [Acidimicrobiales bacterium]|nr:excinuclease ABC subunit UvrC [Acidimicrobiales bacterium]
MLTRPAAGSIPDAPGSYQFLDAHGRVLYVGKAKSLRSRLANYFGDPAGLPPRTAQMVAAADRVEWIQVANEVEAILLEYALIKQHRPRFNIRLVDDKSYPYMAVTVAEEWPRAAVVRGRKRPGIRYFGPYAHVGAIRDTLDLLLRTFQVRSCSDAKLTRHQGLGRPCLLYHIERCSGPCIEAVDHARYDRMVEDLMDFLAGDTDEVERRLTREMQEAAAELDFERAARLRDRLAVLRHACERQQVVTERPEDIDVVGVSEDPLEAAVCVFHVRRGRVVGRRAFVVDKVEELSIDQLVGRVMEALYAELPLATPADEGEVAAQRRPAAGDLPGRRRRPVDASGWTSGAGDPALLAAEGPQAPALPRTVLVPALPDDTAAWERLLAERRGGPVELRVPRRGGKRALMQTVARNAAEELARHRLRRASDHDSRARALH